MGLKTVIDVLLNSWVGMCLIAMSVLLLASLISVILIRLYNNLFYKQNTIKTAEQIPLILLKYITNIAPTMGLLGTIYGMLLTFQTASPSEIPQYIGTALTTTYVGSILFVIGYSTLYVFDKDTHK